MGRWAVLDAGLNTVAGTLLHQSERRAGLDLSADADLDTRVAVAPYGKYGAYDDGSLLLWGSGNGGKYHDIPSTRDWDTGAFELNGRRLLMAPEGAADSVLAVELGGSIGGSVSSIVVTPHEIPLRGDIEPGSRVRVQGWIGLDERHVLVTIQAPDGEGWSDDADLAVVGVLGSGAAWAPVEVVGLVEAGGSTSFSFASDLPTLANPTSDFAAEGSPATDETAGTETPSTPSAEKPSRTLPLLGAGLAAVLGLSALAVFAVGRRRKTYH